MSRMRDFVRALAVLAIAAAVGCTVKSSDDATARVARLEKSMSASDGFTTVSLALSEIESLLSLIDDEVEPIKEDLDDTSMVTVDIAAIASDMETFCTKLDAAMTTMLAEIGKLEATIANPATDTATKQAATDAMAKYKALESRLDAIEAKVAEIKSWVSSYMSARGITSPPWLPGACTGAMGKLNDVQTALNAP